MISTCVRKMRIPEDVPTVVQLVNLAFMEDAFFKRPSKAQRLKISRQDEHGVENIEDLLSKSFFLVYEEMENLLGCVRVEVLSKGLGTFGMLSVNPQNARRGIGTCLIAAAENNLAVLGCTQVEILVINIQPHVIALYEKLGYVNDSKEIEFDNKEMDSIVSDAFRGKVKFFLLWKTLPKHE